MDAEEILWRLRILRQNDAILVPNVNAPWECDLLTITRAGYAHEFEIKVSRSDFLADFKKDKHQIYASGACRKENPWYGHHPGWEIPCSFWFVTALGIATIKDIPDYAGWLEITQSGRIKTHKVAPKIHKVKVSPEFKIKALESMMFRYWTMRSKLRRR